MINTREKRDCLDFLKSLSTHEATICFADFQYRGILDKMNYGNGEEKQKERHDLPQMSMDYIIQSIEEIMRVLQPSGYLFMWVDKFHLINNQEFFASQKGLKKPAYEVVDLITWDKTKMGMGYRSRVQQEFLIIIQKSPKLAKATWLDRGIRDVHSEKIEGKNHPHQKPKGLIERLIQATCFKGDELVIDPCAGSFIVGDICGELGVNFKGNDIVYGTEYDPLDEV